MWFSASGAHMPWDCSCPGEFARTGMSCMTDYTYERGKRELLTGWADGAQNN